MKQVPVTANFRRDDPAFGRTARHTVTAEPRAIRMLLWPAASPDREGVIPPHDDSSPAWRRAAEDLVAINARLRKELIRLRREAAEARHAAHHDPLTGLANRALLADRLEQAMARAARQQKRVGLLFLDLDGFKGVNDRLGHAAGDQLLQQVARRLAASVRACDTACRYGGDEFVIMLPDLERTPDLSAVARKICNRISAPYMVNGTATAVTVSVGVAICNGADGKDCGELLRQADEAMYRSKRTGATDRGSVGLRG